MKNFDKIDIVSVVAIVIIVAITAIFVEKIHKEFMDSRLQLQKPVITDWKYKGHDMVRYQEGKQITVFHSPECGKCCQIFD